MSAVFCIFSAEKNKLYRSLTQLTFDRVAAELSIFSQYLPNIWR